MGVEKKVKLSDKKTSNSLANSNQHLNIDMIKKTVLEIRKRYGEYPIKVKMKDLFYQQLNLFFERPTNDNYSRNFMDIPIEIDNDIKNDYEFIYPKGEVE
jgi:hypothetical protein